MSSASISPGGYCASPVPRTLTRACLRSVASTASRTKSASSFPATHCRISGGNIIGVCRSTFTYFVAIPFLLSQLSA
jgi:hypothetical protein